MRSRSPCARGPRTLGASTASCAPGSCAGRCTSCRRRTSRGCASCSPHAGRRGRGGGSRSSASTRRRPTARWGRWRRALEDGPLTRAEVAALLERAGLPCTGQAPVHVLGAAAARGRARPRDRRTRSCRRPPRGHVPADPLAELARRHLASRAPARAGGPRRLVGPAAGPGAHRVEEPRRRRAGRRLGAARPRARTRCRDDLVRLLPMFDELLLGWTGPDAGRPRRPCEGRPPGRRDPARDGHRRRPRRRDLDAGRRRALRARPRARARGRAQARALACGSRRVIVTRASSSAVATPR